jgi:hypothetical protein
MRSGARELLLGPVWVMQSLSPLQASRTAFGSPSSSHLSNRRNRASLCLFDRAIRCQTCAVRADPETLPDSLRHLARSAVRQLRFQKLKVRWYLVVRQELQQYGKLSSRFQDHASCNQLSQSWVRDGESLHVSCAAEHPLCQSREAGFLFSAMEMETAVRLKLNRGHMVCLDETETYAMVGVEERAKYKRRSGRISVLSTWSSTLRLFAAKGLIHANPAKLRGAAWHGNPPSRRRSRDRVGAL